MPSLSLYFQFKSCWLYALDVHLLLNFHQNVNWKVSKEDEIKFSLRTVHFLLPWLKELHHEQMQEKSVEAATKGSMIATSAFGFLVYVHGFYSLVIDIFGSLANFAILVGIEAGKLGVPLTICGKNERIYWSVWLYLQSICKLLVL